MAAITLLALAYAFLDAGGMLLVYPILIYAERGPEGLTGADIGQLGGLLELLQGAGFKLTLPLLLVLAFAPFLVRQYIAFLRVTYVARVSQDVIRRLISSTTRRYLESDFRFLSSQNRGQLYSSIWNDSRYAGGMIAQFGDLFSALAIGLAYAMLMFYLSWKLAAIILPTFILLGWLFRGQSHRSSAAGTALSRSHASVMTSVNEALNGFPLIKTRVVVDEAVARIDRDAAGMARASVAYDRIRAIVDNAPQPFLMAISLMVFYIAVAVLGMRLAELAAFIFTATRLVPIVSRVGAVYAGLTGAYSSCDTLLRLREEAIPETTANPTGKIFTGLARGIRFDEVDFRYGPSAGDQAVLSKVSFDMARGETVAIVGRSGAGKSTLTALLTRFCNPVSGTIWVDDVSITEYETASFRRHIAYVPQEPVIFDDTIRGNLQFGQQRTLSDTEIFHYLERAHCLDFIAATPTALDATVGERGSRLSGGQRQRLALARALAGKPELLILDEPTSALDGQSEHAIQQTLDELRGELTIFVVAHRLATIIGADRIVVLDRGRVDAVGTHRELLSRSAVYRDLFASQVRIPETPVAS